jgi:hypothetical protein
MTRLQADGNPEPKDNAADHSIKNAASTRHNDFPRERLMHKNLIPIEMEDGHCP